MGPFFPLFLLDSESYFLGKEKRLFEDYMNQILNSLTLVKTS